MKVGIIKNSWIKNLDYRLDASCQLNESRSVTVLLDKIPVKKLQLNEVATKIYNGPRFKRYYVKDDERGIPFMGSSDMLKSNLRNLKYISKRYSKNIDDLIIKKDWILVSCSGTIGNTAFTNQNFENVTASQHIMRVIPDREKIMPGFLYAFLTSKYGYILLTQGTYGAVIQHIEPHHIENIPIPIMPDEFQKKIHNLILEVSALRVKANELIKDALELFENEINKSKATLGFQHGKISYKNINKFHKRLDSQFQLVWNQLEEEKSADLKYIKLSVLASKIFVGGRGKRNYVENGIPFLSSSDIMLFNPKRNCKKVGVNTIGLKEMKVAKNDILISRSGTVGNSVIVGDELKETAISEHALRLIIDPIKISPYYVFAYLNTSAGKKSMEASSFGSVIITLNEDLIGNIELPILDENVQKIIIDNVKGYVSHLDRATSL